MSASTRRKIWFLLAASLLVAALGLLVLWGVRSFLALSQGGSGAVNYDTPTQLASVSVSDLPNSLAWSADGNYLAAGTWGSPPGRPALARYTSWT
jgi:hypothetical protein